MKDRMLCALDESPNSLEKIEYQVNMKSPNMS